MPYLDSKIEKHKTSCFNPVGKRLYIRDYDNKGKQRFVSWGLTCTTCGVVIKERYRRNLTPRELKDREQQRKLPSEYTRSIEKLTGRPYETWEERFETSQKERIVKKLRRLLRKKAGEGPITPKESGLRTRLKNLKDFYGRIARYYISNSPDEEDKGEGNTLVKLWDDKLVNQFLDLIPRPSMSELKKVLQPTGSTVNVDSKRRHRYRYIGYVPNPEKPGWLKYDKDEYIELLESEALKRKEMMQEIININQIR